MKVKNEKGSVTIFVLVGLLFMSAFLIISYASNVNKSKVVKEQSDIIQDLYMKNENIADSYEEAYASLRNKNKQTVTKTVHDTSSIELTNTFDGNLINYRIYGTGTKNLYPTNEGFLPQTGNYPVENATYPNATYQIIEIKEGQTLNFNYTGSGIENLRIRYIDSLTNKCIHDVKIEENDYYISTIHYSFNTVSNGYITAKKDFKLGIMYIVTKPDDFNIEYVGGYKVGDLVTDVNNENYGKYNIPIRVSSKDGNSIIKDIILDTPLYENDYIEYKLGRVVRNDGTIESVDLPKLSIFEDYTKIEILTETIPKKIEVEYENYQFNKLDNYKILEYIESTGTQYIDTGIKLNQDSAIELEIELTEDGTYLIFGSRSGPTEENIGIICSRAYNEFILDFQNYQINRLMLAYNANRRIYKISNKELKVDDNVKEIKSFTNFTTPENAYIFNISGNVENLSEYYLANMKLYYCQIWDNGTLVRDFIPCKRNSDGVIGMYDKVNDMFYENAGTGEFIAGPEV